MLVWQSDVISIEQRKKAFGLSTVFYRVLYSGVYYDYYYYCCLLLLLYYCCCIRTKKPHFIFIYYYQHIQKSAKAHHR